MSAAVLAAACAAAGCATTGAPGAAGTGTPAVGARLRVPPVVWWTRDPDGRREVRNFLGFLYDQRAVRAEPGESSPVDLIVRRSSLRVLWPLYGSGSEERANGVRRSTRSMLPFYWASRESEPSGRGTDLTKMKLAVPPLLLWLRSDNWGSGVLKCRFLWVLGRYFRGERHSRRRGRREMARSFRFLPFVSYERFWPLATGVPGRERARPGAGSGTGRPGEVVRLSVLKPLFGYDRDADRRRKRAFLLGGIAEGEGAEEERTLGLLAAESGPATDYEFQALWQFFVMKRSGAGDIASSGFGPERPSDLWRATKWLFGGSPRRLFKIGPIVSHESDWSADRRRFSVLFGLVSYFREGRSKGGRLLWVIPWRSGG